MHVLPAGFGDPTLAQPRAATPGADPVGFAALDVLPTGPQLSDTPPATPGVDSSPALPHATPASTSATPSRARAEGPPPGFPPLGSGVLPLAAPSPPGTHWEPPARAITQVYTRRPREATPLLLPQGVMAVPLVTNQHPMTTRAKSGFRVLTLPRCSAVSSAQDLPQCPCRSFLEGCYGKGTSCLVVEPHLGSRSTSARRQRGHQEVDLQTQVQC